MAKKRINLAIDPELDKRWTRIAKQLGWTKSGMLEDLLIEVLPYLEDLEPKKIIPKSMRAMADKLKELSELVDEGSDSRK